VIGRLVETQGVLPYDSNEFSTPYVIYWQNSNRGIAVLYFSRFINISKAYPVKYFVPECDAQVGNSSTIWHTYPNQATAIKAINETIKRINSHFKVECNEIIEKL
jgi:hypothetical protein